MLNNRGEIKNLCPKNTIKSKQKLRNTRNWIGTISKIKHCNTNLSFMAIPIGDIIDMAKIYFSIINFPKPIEMKKYLWLVSMKSPWNIFI